MPYKRGNVYYIDIEPPGYPHRLVRSTKQSSLSVARQMRVTVTNLAMQGAHEALDALRNNHVTLPDLHAAYMAGTVDDVIHTNTDPPLVNLASRFSNHTDDRRYQLAVERLLDIAPANARASWLTEPGNVQELVDLYRREGLSPATEHRELMGIGVLIRRIHGERARRDVFDQLDTRRVPKSRKVRYLSTDELQRLREHAGGWWRVILLSVSTGIRRGELLSLRRKDVDLDTRLLIVESGKSDAARRSVPVAGECLQMLVQWVANNNLDPDGPMFPGVTDNRLQLAWNSIRDKAGVDKRWHDLRHTYGVYCAKAGMPIRELQKRMGHSSITTTEVYMEYAPPQRSSHYEEALDKMGVSSV